MPELMCGYCGNNPVEDLDCVCSVCEKIFQSRRGVAPTAEKIASVRKSLCELDYLRGFPTADKAIERVARVVATFADTEPRWHRRLGGIVIPFHWMLDRCIQDTDFFPSVKTMRNTYSVYFKPLDSKEFDFWKHNMEE